VQIATPFPTYLLSAIFEDGETPAHVTVSISDATAAGDRTSDLSGRLPDRL